MPDKDNNSTLSLISEILDKMIDMQSSTTEVLTSLRIVVETSASSAATATAAAAAAAAAVARNVQEISDQFANGFRSELKQHITDEINKHQSEVDKHEQDVPDVKKEIINLNSTVQGLDSTVQEFRELMSKPAYWVKLILTTIVATATAIGGVVALVFKLMS